MSIEQVEMDGGKFDNRKRIGSEKVAMNLYKERILEGNSTLKKPQMDLSVEAPARKRELHLAWRDIGRLNESRRVADSEKARAESELSDAKKTVKDITLRIEETNSRAKTQIQDLEKPEKPKRHEVGQEMAIGNAKNYQYVEVTRELECIKQELSKLKLDMASALEEKRKAEKETEASSSRMWFYSSSVEALTKQIEELNEEHVLVELARIEALKEIGAIEVQRKEEAWQYSSAVEETRKKVNDIIQETCRAKDLETKLAATSSDVTMLQNELALLKEMGKMIERNESLKHLGASFQKWDESDSPSLLESITKELEATKKELACIKEEGYQFMASMDIIREELQHVVEETGRLKKKEEKTNLTIQNLNSKLLRAKAKLEAVSAAEKKAKSIVSNLSLTLEQLKTEAEAAKKERETIGEETAKIKAEFPKTEAEIDIAEERVQATLQELESVKSSEAIALEKLKTLIENTMTARAAVSQHSSTITISSFEYEYLTGRAVGVEEMANKKVAAAQAWIEALKASKKEILMKTEIAQREIRELRMEEEHEVDRIEQPLSAKRVVERELQNWGQKRDKNLQPENLSLEVATPKKTMNKKGIGTPTRPAKFRKAASPATRHMTRSTSFRVKRRGKVMPNLAKLFSRKNNENDV